MYVRVCVHINMKKMQKLYIHKCMHYDLKHMLYLLHLWIKNCWNTMCAQQGMTLFNIIQWATNVIFILSARLRNGLHNITPSTMLTTVTLHLTNMICKSKRIRYWPALWAYLLYIEMEMLPFWWWDFYQGLYRKVPKSELPVQPVIKISSNDISFSLYLCITDGICMECRHRSDIHNTVIRFGFILPF